MNENTNELDGAAALDDTQTAEAAPEQDVPLRAEVEPAGAAGIPAAPAGAPAAAGGAPDPGADPADSAELSRLREELTRLREELARKESVSFRLGRECAEFRDLYPETPLSSVPDEVWNAVRDGVPLPAAFALAERRRERLEQAAKDSNRRNLARSSGDLGQEAPGYFSPEEVRRMSRDEVRENYSNILLSMQNWH